MKKAIFLVGYLLLTSIVIAQNIKQDYSLIKVSENNELGFNYPYYLYVLKTLSQSSHVQKVITLLVVPNNTGTLSDSILVHENVIKNKY